MKIANHTCLMLALIASVFPGSVNATTAGQLKQRSLLTGVTPEPQEVFEYKTSELPFTFSSDTVIWVKNSADRIGAELLRDDLQKQFGLDVSIVEGETGSNVTSFVLLERSDNAEGMDRPALQKLGATQDEGYRMVVKNGECVIQGHDARGTLYGIQTLRQLILSNATVDPIVIRDWPEMSSRVSYCGLYRDIEKIKAHVRRCARLKMNTVILESYWNGPQNWWYNHTGGRQKLAQQFFDECRKYHIEPVPLVQGFGWGYGVTDLIPMAAEGVWGEDEPVVLYHDKGTDLNRPNVVTTTNTAPIIVTSETGENYELGTDFEIIPGLTRRPYKKDNKRWQLRAIPGGKIADGQTVLVDYNAVSPGPHKSYCPAEPRTYELVDRTIDRVMKTYKPNVIHIGHDELFNSMTDSRSLNSGMTKSELVLRDVMHWYKRIKMHNPDVKIMMWSDFLQHREGDRKGPLLEVVDQLPKDIIMCPWIYKADEQSKARMAVEVDYQHKQGFQSIGAAAGYFPVNNLDWYNVLSARLPAKGGSVQGMMFTYWGDGPLLQSCLPNAADLMWSGNKLDMDLFTHMTLATKRLRVEGLSLTFDLDSQKKVLVDRFNEKLLSGHIPSDIAESFRKDLLDDERFLSEIYGAKRWKELRGVFLPEQYAGMLQQFALFVDAMAMYAQTEYELSNDNNISKKVQITTIIDTLEEIGCLSTRDGKQLKSTDGKKLPASEQLFGFTLGRYLSSSSDKIVTPISASNMMRESVAGYELIQFKRPVALSRISGKGLRSRYVYTSTDGKNFSQQEVKSDLVVADGEMVSALRISPTPTKEVIFYEERPLAVIQASATPAPPVVDGELNDSVWQDVSSVTSFLTPKGHQAIQQTRVRVTWDTDNLYAAFQCERRPGESIDSHHFTFDTYVHEDESIQLFLDTNLDRKSYYQIIVNTAGTIMDRHAMAPVEQWNSNATVATKVTEKFWTVEMSIPLSSLNIANDLSEKTWGINFCRSQQGSPKVNSTWAPLNSGQAYYFLQPAAFGDINFK